MPSAMSRDKEVWCECNMTGSWLLEKNRTEFFTLHFQSYKFVNLRKIFIPQGKVNVYIVFLVCIASLMIRHPTATTHQYNVSV